MKVINIKKKMNKKYTIILLIESSLFSISNYWSFDLKIISRIANEAIIAIGLQKLWI